MSGWMFNPPTHFLLCVNDSLAIKFLCPKSFTLTIVSHFSILSLSSPNLPLRQCHAELPYKQSSQHSLVLLDACLTNNWFPLSTKLLQLDFF